MGKLFNMCSAKVSGNAGAWNFRVRGGQIVQAARSYTNKSKGSGASFAQRAHRCKLANFVNLYKHFKPIMKGAFGKLPANTSEFNYFVKKNITTSNIYLSRQQANAGFCSAYNYLVAEGPLAPIKCFGVHDMEAPESLIGFGYEIPSGKTEDTYTLGDFSTAFLQSNKEAKEGDCVVIFLCGLHRDQVEDEPRFFMQYSKFVLDTTATTIFRLSLHPGWYIEDTESNGLCIMGLDVVGQYSCGAGCFITRGEGSSMITSTCYMAAPPDMAQVVADNFPMEDAMSSYGYQDPILISSASV